MSFFDFFNGSAGKTRLRCSLYYFIFYLGNAGMIGAWYAEFGFTESWYYLPLLLVVVTTQGAGSIFLQVYFFYFSSSPRGTALCGLCCRDEIGSGSAAARYRAALADIEAGSIGLGSVSDVVRSQLAHPFPPPREGSLSGLSAAVTVRQPSLYKRQSNHLSSLQNGSEPHRSR